MSACPVLRPRRDPGVMPSFTRMWPSTYPTASALAKRNFRGSIARPADSLCTLHNVGYPHAVQHSVPVAGTLTGRDWIPVGSLQKVSEFTSSSSSRLALAHWESFRWNTRSVCDVCLSFLSLSFYLSSISKTIKSEGRIHCTHRKYKFHRTFTQVVGRNRKAASESWHLSLTWLPSTKALRFTAR